MMSIPGGGSRSGPTGRGLGRAVGLQRVLVQAALYEISRLSESLCTDRGGHSLTRVLKVGGHPVQDVGAGGLTAALGQHGVAGDLTHAFPAERRQLHVLDQTHGRVEGDPGSFSEQSSAANG